MSEARLVFYVVSAITLGMAAIIGVIVLFVD
jgi:type III secretory pathway component EscS